MQAVMVDQEATEYLCSDTNTNKKMSFIVNSYRFGIVYDPDAILYFNQVVINGGGALTPYWKGKINTYILSLKARGEFTKWVRLHHLHNQHEIAARTSIVNPSQAMCIFNGANDYVYRAFKGFVITTSTPNTSYIDTNFNPFTDGAGIFTINSATQGVGVEDPVDGTFVDMGVSDATNRSYIFSSFAGVAYYALNVALAGTDTTAANLTNLGGNYYTQRKASNDHDGYKNDTVVNGAGASLGMPNNNYYVGAYNNNGVKLYTRENATYTWFGFGDGDIDVALHNADIISLHDQKIAYMFGNSITNGNNGPFRVSGCWTNYVCGEKGWKEENRGVNSTCLQYVVPYDPVAPPSMWNNMAAIPVYDSDTMAALSFNYAVNDCGYNFPNYTVANYESQLSDVLDYAITTKGWPAAKIFVLEGTLVDPARWEDYVTYSGVPVAADQVRYDAMQAAAQAQCLAKGCVFVNPKNYMIANGNLTLLNDGIHPNLLGYTKIGEYAVTQLTTIP